MSTAYMPRDHAIDTLRRRWRRAMHTARYWRSEAVASYCVVSRAECLRMARMALASAAVYRRALAVEKSYHAVAWRPLPGVVRYGAVVGIPRGGAA